jgi:hypothetical protein
MACKIHNTYYNFDCNLSIIDSCLGFFMPQQVTRVVHFFQIEQTSPLEAAIKSIVENKIEDRQEFSRVHVCQYQHTEDEEVIRFALATTRLTDFPSVGKPNETDLYDLNLAEGEGIAEMTHFVYFPKTKILVVEYNHRGPRIGSLISFLNKVSTQLGLERQPHFFYKAIFNREMQSKLDKFSVVTKLEVAATKAQIASIKEVDDHLLVALDSIANTGATDLVDLTISVKRKSRQDLDPQKSFLNKLLGVLSKEKASNKLKIVGVNTTTDRLEEIDLLKERLEQSVQVVRIGSGRKIDSNQMFQNMINAYHSQRSDLLQQTNTIE